MKYVTNGYEPKKLYEFFEIISAIPRGSGNEKGIADYIESFAEERKLFCIRDKFNNVFIRKPATAGYEDLPTVMLQGHTDMVCEKNNDTVHDFLTDPLDLYIENGWLKARGTTLGGDDGAAVATMLAILDSTDLSHPEIECLFTTGEETGLYGATGFDYSNVRAKELINLDSEAEGIVTVSCAGGIGLDFTLKPDRITVPTIARPISVEISGLFGGHSGADIISERGNANVLLIDLLSALYEKHPFNIITVNGGSRGNAIPREAGVVIFTSEPDESDKFIRDYARTLHSWLPTEDKNLKIKVSKAKGTYDKMLSFADTLKIINLVTFMPNGVIARMKSKPDMVETSNNLGVIKDNGEEGIVFIYHGRSSLDSRMDQLELTAKRAAKTLGFELDVNGRYSGWPMKTRSKLTDKYIASAKDVLGDKCEPEIVAIHAGVECGIICSAVKGLDAISIGPELINIHSPEEALELSSFGRMWEIVIKMLAYK